ncbi:MAG: 30S ribosomal protein S9 [Candidatus Pacearchaeota archaeon]
MTKENILIASGKRKTSIAKAFIVNGGNGEIIINNVDYNVLNSLHKLYLDEPIKIAKKYIKNIDFNINVKIRGGGRESQIEAARLAIARAIIERTKSERLKKAFEKYDKHLLIADVRRKEAYKPDDSKARAKRQTSYR